MIIREWLGDTWERVNIEEGNYIRGGCVPRMRGIRGGMESMLAALADNAMRSVLESMAETFEGYWTETELRREGP
jgi:hypothetical protein